MGENNSKIGTAIFGGVAAVITLSLAKIPEIVKYIGEISNKDFKSLKQPSLENLIVDAAIFIPIAFGVGAGTFYLLEKAQEHFHLSPYNKNNT